MAYRRPERVCNSGKKNGLSYIEKIFVKFLILLGVIFLLSLFSLTNPSTPVTPSVSDSTRGNAIREQILQKVEDRWMSGIEEKYSELVEAYETDQKQKVLDLLEEFREHDKLDYMNVAEINIEAERFQRLRVQRYRQAKTAQWYQGGTLHKANFREWQASEFSNRLATSADFVKALYRADGLPAPNTEELMKDAVYLENAISAASTNPPLDRMEVAEFVATIWAIKNQ